jgi:hypothetical protein
MHLRHWQLLAIPQRRSPVDPWRRIWAACLSTFAGDHFTFNSTALEGAIGMAYLLLSLSGTAQKGLTAQPSPKESRVGRDGDTGK